MATKKNDTPPKQKLVGEEAPKGPEHEVLEHEVTMDENTATDVLNAGDTTPVPEVSTRSSLGAYKAKRLNYDLACIIGGKITGVVTAKEMGGDTDKIGLVVKIESAQRPEQTYIVWPVQDLQNLMAPVTDFEINQAE